MCVSVDSIMTKKVVSVDMDDRLEVVRELFVRHRFHHLLVTDKKGCLVGVISDRDYFKETTPNVDLPAANTKDLATLQKRVHRIPTRKLVCIEAGDSLKNAITKFRQYKISCLPVVNSERKPIGIITWRDLIRWLYDRVS
jgi:acetoin utilization protein AcuB